MSGDDDLLERATRALRAAPPPTDEEIRVERAVLLRARRAATEKTSKRRTLRWVLPLAAALTAGSALAATTEPVERAVRAVSAWISGAPRAAAPKRAKRVPAREQVVRERPDLPEPALPPAIAPSPTPAAAPPPVVAPEPARAAPSAPRGAALPEPTRRRTAPHSPAKPRESEAAAVDEQSRSASSATVEPADAPEAPSLPSANADLIRYREAHRLHFRERDMWAALRAWESYLSVYPDGTFAVEARYNRAICLLHLGRKREARRALVPFAEGAVADGYRKSEASELLKALE